MSGAADSVTTRWRAHPVLVTVACAGLTIAIGVGDLLTGPYLVFATFYLLPVAAAAWFANRTVAITIGVLAAASGMTSTAIDPGAVTAPVILWNGTFRFLTYLAVALLVCAQRGAYDQIHALASTDPLTGLLNRRRFYELAERELVRAQRSASLVAMVYVDVDDLKVRNDTIGHEAGDAMLVAFADRARASVRAIDLVARVGGDEFCLLLPGADRSEAEAVVRRLTDALAALDPEPIRVSIGLVAGDPDPTVDVELLVRRADALMLEAKRAGKGRVRAADHLDPGDPHGTAAEAS